MGRSTVLSSVVLRMGSWVGLLILILLKKGKTGVKRQILLLVQLDTALLYNGHYVTKPPAQLQFSINMPSIIYVPIRTVES